MKTKLFLFLSILNLIHNIYVYQPEEVLNFFNNYYIEGSTLTFIINNLIKIFNDIYAYTEISKSPIQPKFDNNYFKKVFIIERLKQIETKNINFYSFYQEIKTIFSDVKDGHLSFNMEKLFPFLQNMLIFDPLKLYIRMVNDEPRIFSFPYLEIDIKDFYKNNDYIYKIIENNVNTPIKLINGKDPFNYITSFGEKYSSLKNPYGAFTLKFLEHNLSPLISYPLSLEELTNFTVVYDSGDNFTTDLLILSQIDIDERDTGNNNSKIYDNSNSNTFNKYNKKLSKLGEDFDIKKQKIQINNNNYFTNEGWDFHFLDIFKCKVDNNNKVNIYYINSFSGGSNKEFFEEVKKCGLLFDKNTYPIILITSLNKGGQNIKSQILLEILSPLSTINFYASYRKTDSLLQNMNIKRYSAENCKLKSYKELTKNYIEINYGNNVSDNLSEPFIMNGRDLREELNSFKLKLKNKRKPTDIIVFTDGFSFSAMSVLIKYMKYYGGGITVGYFGNPNIKNIPFDGSISASGIFKNDTLYKISPEYRQLHDKYGITMTITGRQLFYNPVDMNMPLEYDITPVDEKVNIYELFNDNNYNIFIQEALKIFDKYKTGCNKNNKKLVLVDSKCDKFFENEYTHGGYECRDDGTWSNRCVPSYCDQEYIFDHNKKKCVIDECSKINKIISYTIFISILILLIVLTILFKVMIRKKYKNKYDKYNKYESLELGYYPIINNN